MSINGVSFSVSNHEKNVYYSFDFLMLLKHFIKMVLVKTQKIFCILLFQFEHNNVELENNMKGHLKTFITEFFNGRSKNC